MEVWCEELETITKEKFSKIYATITSLFETFNYTPKFSLTKELLCLDVFYEVFDYSTNFCLVTHTQLNQVSTAIAQLSKVTFSKKMMQIMTTLYFPQEDIHSNELCDHIFISIKSYSQSYAC